jgi:P-type Cu+ transporter
MKLAAVEGVVAAVNFATEKAIVSAPQSVSPDLLIEAVQQAGYEAKFSDPGAAEAGPAGGPASPDAGSVGYLRRLIVALVFFVPLGDLSVLLSLFPAFRFAGSGRAGRPSSQAGTGRLAMTSLSSRRRSARPGPLRW